MPVYLPDERGNLRKVVKGNPVEDSPKHSRRVTMLEILSRFGWLIVAGAALALSAYSLYWVGRRYGVPPILAGMISVIFDGAAVISCDLALRYARSHDSGFAPRLAVFTFAGVSAFLNAQHAILAGLPKPAVILFSSPPIVAVVMLELHTRYTKRAALKRAGRVPAALPIIGRVTWALFPIKSYRTLRKIVGARLRILENQAGIPETSQVVSGIVSELPHSSGKPQVVRAWARMQGMNPPERGPLPQSITAAYLLAITAGTPAEMNGHGNSHETESETS
jgi:hypothetical protein